MRGDSIYFDFTINSPTKEMYQVALFQLGAALPNLRINLDESNRHTYSGVIKGVVGANGFGNLKDGANTFRIWAYDKQGVYLGDGYKTITINVNNKIMHIVNRKIYFPDVDSANGSANSYISLNTGETFNYQTGAANSDKIDLGIYRVGEQAPMHSVFIRLARHLYLSQSLIFHPGLNGLPDSPILRAVRILIFCVVIQRVQH
ncbi:hypothetical protein [Niabella hibiscisoli]|uniref:hypothetical protein n=1 Tax=Niabella hibiscisoli TaxID=1825928 RepID=UPI001F0EA41B|nr:hypothetical protein [Niabella hibiscisoli]MCH5720264.1 hypothetical protein [Niabella hibiscisoli]